MNIKTYLQRIHYTGSRSLTAETLCALHRAHMLAVPFENLSIHSGERIHLNHKWLFDKIATRKRGGFCYECNGLFSWLLHALGFEVTLLSARVSNSSGKFGQEYDHLVLKVDLEEPWLADVGFGASFLEPLRLRIGEEQNDPAGKFRIVNENEGFILQEWDGGRWSNQHFFTLAPREFHEFEAMCHYHQTSPQSPFTEKWLATVAKPDGRITQTGTKQTVTRNGIKQELEYDPRETYTLLKKNFEIEGVILHDRIPL